MIINETVEHFKKGGIVIFPTDTLYGIGCVIDNERSIKHLYKIRLTPPNKPTLILAADLNQAFAFGEFSERARNLVNHFWPGPLTVVVKARNAVPQIIQGKNGTIGIRVPNQNLTRSIVKRLGRPILAPSANFHNQPTPMKYNEIDKKLISLVDYAIDISNSSNKSGENMLKKPSTLVDATKDRFEILRTGAISEPEIRKALGGA
jgi:L-threonylcarbamoyladenylate synthase